MSSVMSDIEDSPRLWKLVKELYTQKPLPMYIRVSCMKRDYSKQILRTLIDLLNERCKDLEKENEELKEKVADLQKYIETLSENYENEIAEHKKVIEKMKCCENCKHSYTDCENVVFCRLPISQENCKSCKFYKHEETDKDYWELAE